MFQDILKAFNNPVTIFFSIIALICLIRVEYMEYQDKKRMGRYYVRYNTHWYIALMFIVEGVLFLVLPKLLALGL